MAGGEGGGCVTLRNMMIKNCGSFIEQTWRLFVL